MTNLKHLNNMVTQCTVKWFRESKNCHLVFLGGCQKHCCMTCRILSEYTCAFREKVYYCLKKSETAEAEKQKRVAVW